MKVSNPIRLKLKKHLSAANYVKGAILYNHLCAPFIERNIKRPLTHIVDCGKPLIYVSQAPRCGGTLMRNLLDGHSELHTFPVELTFEKDGYHWEELSGTNKQIYERLTDSGFTHNIHYGIDRKFPFFFNRKIEKKLYLREACSDTRGYLNAYFTAFFNAWTNYQGLYEEKRYVAAFCPWVSSIKQRVDQFYNIYPDGYRIHVIRNPYAWWASEKAYDEAGKSLEQYLKTNWISSVRDGVDRCRERPERYILVDNEKLLKEPVDSMQKLAQKIGINYEHTLVVPTLNKQNRRANTSFGEGRVGIDASVADRWRNKLDPSEIDYIQRTTNDLYNDALDLCVNR